MKLPPIELTSTSLGCMFLAASSLYEQPYQIAEAAWHMFFDDDAILPDHPLTELVNRLVDRVAFSDQCKAA
jgi:hypothetical protein